VAERTIPQRELRNNASAVLSAAEAGESFTVTVRGRAVARVVPLGDADQRRCKLFSKRAREDSNL